MVLKQEIYYDETFTSFDKLEQAIDDYIVYYNHKRMKAKLGYMSPVNDRESMEKIAA